MKYFKIIILLLFLSGSFSVNAQKSKESADQKSYLSDYESKTLDPAQLPVLLPYNRWVDPAGTQITF
ncbi:MAG TPA: hypothetical protein VN249_00960, partial [Prolixibacteraceae bacterium]|nr:hypothetical protein [Prolixibacteraceae bacterium]